MSDIAIAVAIAAEAHKTQKDKVGQPYILHPLRVMFRLETEAERIVGVLHDVLEDTLVTRDDLRRAGFNDAILTALDGVTKRLDAEGKEEPYDAFIERAALNPIARRVKLADLEDNLDLRRLPDITDKDKIRLAKYVKAWHRLREL